MSRSGKIVNSRNLEVDWCLENFAERDMSIGVAFYSPSFHDAAQLTRWCIKLYPGGESDRTREYLSLFLKLESPGPVDASFSFSVLGSESFSYRMKRSCNHCFCNDCNICGFRKFTSRVKLLDHEPTVLPGGNLTLRCRITIESVPLECKYPIVPQCELSMMPLLNNTSHDMTLVVGEEEIEVHRLVLSAMSPVFAAMFAHDTREKQECRVVVDDIESHILKLLVEFAYHGFLYLYETPFSTIENLLIAADKYQMNPLQKFCIRHLAPLLDSHNVVRILILADRFHLENLYAEALEKLKKDPYEVITSAEWIQAMADPAKSAIVGKALQALADSDKDLTIHTFNSSDSELDDVSVKRIKNS